MSAPAQNDRILRALRARGERGVVQTDFLLPAVVDGGTPVLRLPARIAELRDQGHAISSRIEKVGGARMARYRLDGDAGVTQVTPADRHGEQVATSFHLRTGPHLAPSRDERRASELRMTGRPPEGYGFVGFAPESGGRDEQAALDLDAPARRPLSPYDHDVEGC